MRERDGWRSGENKWDYREDGEARIHVHGGEPQHPHANGDGKRDWKHGAAHAAGSLLLFLLLTGSMTVGFKVAKRLFRLTGSPREIAAYLTAFVLGVALMVALGWLLRLIAVLRRSKHPHGQAHGQPYPEQSHGQDTAGQRYGTKTRVAEYFMSDIFEAINRIAKGDFSVLVPLDEYEGKGRNAPFYKLAASVNKMARELGSAEQLRQAFISDVSHEIQSPLTSISGFAALLRKEDVSKEEVLHYAAIIEAESLRLSKLSENLLKLSTLEAEAASFEMESFRLDKQIEKVLLTLEPQWAKKNISPEMSLRKISVDGNEDLLNQVWMNLLHNAIKFTPPGGVIRVTLTEKDGEIQGVVADNGIGIPQKDQIHIFERFYKVDKSRDRTLGGNGLGLPLVRKIVELHGGRVTVESEAGAGTAFTVCLPACQSAAAAEK